MNKTVLVTGSAKGIGRKTIIEFAKNGYNVVINYLTSKKEAFDLKNTVEKLYNVKAIAIKCDITNEDEVKNMTDIIKKEFGKLDVLVNNACLCHDNNYKDKTAKEFLDVLNVNLVGTFLVTKYITNIMDSGVVVNVSSLDSTKTYNEISMDYSASKAGVNSLTKTFHVAIPSIKFIAILPSWVNTESVKEMFPEYLESELKRTNQKRLLEPCEVAEKIFEIVNDEKTESGSLIEFI